MLATLAAAVLAAAPAPSSGDAALQQKLDALAKKHAGKVSFYAKDLTTGRTVAISPDRPMRTASVIKLAVLLAAADQLKAGKRTLADVLTLDKENVVGGSGVLWFLEPGLKLKLSDALSLMIIVSDNTATNLVVDAVGLEAVNAVSTRLGLTQTRMFRKVGKYPKVPDQNEKDFGLGKTTAREAAALLEAIERCDGWDKGLCKKMLEMLISQQYRSMAPRYLEVSDEGRTAVADKVGQLNQTRNDVALVYTEAGPLVVSAFTTDNADARWTCESEPEQLIGKMTKLVVDSWSPKGLRKNGPPQLEEPADGGTR